MLANYLDQIIRPLYINNTCSTSLLNGSAFMQKLQYFSSQINRFRPRTNLATFTVHHLYTKISHSALIRALQAFLVNPIELNREERLSSEAIEQLAALVLRNNFFSYNQKI
ncbi:unnamed protein product [Rotaria sp. Silwood2]|nr:unnamed protein product [Rotaria sp. Silwood2]